MYTMRHMTNPRARFSDIVTVDAPCSFNLAELAPAHYQIETNLWYSYRKVSSGASYKSGYVVNLD